MLSTSRQIQAGISWVPRLERWVSDEKIAVIILHAIQKLGYDKPTDEQAEAVRQIILGRDVFVSHW